MGLNEMWEYLFFVGNVGFFPQSIFSGCQQAGNGA